MGQITFLAKTAYRDSRKNRAKLFMFMSSIILGIMALVAINSFNHNLVRDIDNQTKSILGADIKTEGKQPLPPNLQFMLDSVPGERASEMEFFSMAYVPKSDETQFVRIKAIEGEFPFYGKLVTQPEEASNTYQASGSALVDDALMFEYDLKVGDMIKLGEKEFPIAGRLMNSVGTVSLGSSFAPTIYIDQEYVTATGLAQAGSIIEYKYYIKTPEGFDREEWDNSKSRMAPFHDADFNVTTIEDQKRRLGRAFDFLNSFLNLIALVSLILGCIGVASSVFIYIKSKIPSIAVFRCLGMTGNQAFLVYFLQIFVLGFIAVLIGAALGSGLQVALPILLKDILPYEVNMSISWRAIGQGLSIGAIVTSLFAMLPLLAVRLVSPLRTLRSSFDEDVTPRDPLKYLVFVGIIITLVIFLWSLTRDWQDSFIFCAALLTAFLVLYGVASLIMWAVKKFVPTKWNFVFRQGLSNLYRPDNQTRTLIVSIGLGTAILTLLYIIQGLILSNVNSMDAGGQPNMILYGIETYQKDDIAAITEKQGMPVVQQVPIVTMRLEGWKGRNKSEWMKDSIRTFERWVVHREARVTYRDSLEFDETLIEGTFEGEVAEGDSVFISVDKGWAESLDVWIGDELEWNVQGAMIKTYISSIREIEFRSMRTRFFVLFPNGVLEEAPQFHVLVTKSPNNAVMGDYRRAVVRAYPNVSVVDLGSILTTLNDILSKISYVIKFMAGFSILTGLIVLISSLLLSKYQRIRESVLLRTIGAQSKQILKINATEYALLGSLSALTGIGIAIIGSYFLASSELDLEFKLNWWPILLIFLFIVALTVFIGVFNTREVLRRSPLEVLRKEVG